MDVVLLAANHPRLRDADQNIETILADGVQCAIEVKPDLSDLPVDFGKDRKQKPEIVRALEQVQTVKKLRRYKTSVLFRAKADPDVLAYAERVPTHILTCKTRSLDELQDFVASYYLEKAIPIHEQVDVIVCLDAGLLINHKVRARSLAVNGTQIPLLVRVAHGSDTLAHFVRSVASDMGPEPRMSSPILAHYLANLPFVPDEVRYSATTVAAQAELDRVDAG
jgi:hypothetical protein